MLKELLKITCEQAGAIIGKNGYKIKEMRKLTNASIKIDSSGKSHRVVQLEGTAENVALAKHLIQMHISRHEESKFTNEVVLEKLENRPDFKAAATSLAKTGNL